MTDIHIPVDGNHLTLCHKCTCSDKTLKFNKDSPTCPKCITIKTRTSEILKMNISVKEKMKLMDEMMRALKT